MDFVEAGLLVATGLIAGSLNTLAGGGSMLSVPLLVALGLPGDLANGTNRIGIFFQSSVAAWRFRRGGIPGLAQAWPLLVPVALGSVIGAVMASRLASGDFERIFGVVMIALLIPIFRKPRKPEAAPPPPWPLGVQAGLFFLIGLYGGFIQAGVGLLLMLALHRTGYDLVRVNSMKVIVVGVLTALAIPVFILKGQVAWAPAACLTVGFALGGAVGARWALIGGERLIRIALVLAVLALAGRMLGIY